MITDEEKSKKFIDFIWEKRMQMSKEKHRIIKDNEMARWLGVSVGSFNQWINGNRLPSYPNIMKLSSKLGSQIFEIFGYSKAAVIDDPQLMYLAEQWTNLSEDSRKYIIELVKEKTDVEYNQQ